MRVHLDTDFGGDTDDACALAYLLARDDVDLVGVTTVADADGRRAAYVRYLLELAGRAGVPVAAGAARSLTTGEQAEPEHGDWPDLPLVPEPPGAALDLLDRSIAAGAAVIGIGPFTNLAAYETLRPGRLRAPTLMAGYADPPAPGLPPWGPEHDFNNQWDRRAYEIVLATRPTLATLPATLVTWARSADVPRLRAAGPIGGLLADQLVAHRRRNGRPPGDALPDDLLNFQFDPAACAVALGWPGATVEDTAVRLTPDGAVARDPAGYPVRLLTVLDGAAFNSHWLDTIECLTSARRPADRVRDHRVRADPGRHQCEGQGCDLAGGRRAGVPVLPADRTQPRAHDRRGRLMADEIDVDNTHGQPGFDRDAPPAVRVAAGAGDRIALETSDEAYRQMDERRDLAAVTATINPVTGPVYVEGAEPGDALAVTVHEIRLTGHGWSIYLPGVGALARPMGTEMFVRKVPLDDAGVHLTDRITVPAAPMIGCIGVAPAGAAASTVMPSYPTGGNMDLTDAHPGATVYLPVEVPGALLSVGDIHAVMARGESSFVAIEAEGTAVVSVDVVKGLRLRAPRIDTGNEIVFVGLGDPVQESIARGYEDAFAFLTGEQGWSAGDAYAVLSACAHSELGGPTGSTTPDPLHPLTPIGAVTLHRFPKALL